MAREPQRRDEPRHLDAAIVPLERALIARAKTLETMAGSEVAVSTDPADAVIMARIATEFRALADELHHW